MLLANEHGAVMPLVRRVLDPTHPSEIGRLCVLAVAVQMRSFIVQNVWWAVESPTN